MKLDEKSARRPLPIGAEIMDDGTTRFRLWAPKCQSVELVLESAPGAAKTHELKREAGGYFSATANAGVGTLYRYRLKKGGPLFADPASRFQPQGPEGPSQVVDPDAFRWSDRSWPGVELPHQVLYELHIGTFTPEGTWGAAEQKLPELAKLGITMLEVMPVAEWPGAFGWGYDAVSLFAPMHVYGTADDMRSFVDRAHALGIGVALDVVYNHLGSRANHLREFSEDYFAKCHANEWGDAINFDQPNCGPVREFFLSNARYWIEEFHLDGYRIDATQAFCDASADHILAAITREARGAAGKRPILIVAENEPQQVRMVRPLDQGGYGMDALWNDDFHHSAMVRLTGRREAYYTDYLGAPDEFIAMFKWGYLYQGQRYSWQGKPRGAPTFGLSGATFVNYLQNHDQLANSARGVRLHQLTSPGRYRAMTAVLLLGPGTPLLFQGQEFGASTPFCYFLDNPPEQAKAIAKGRAKFLEQFRSLRLDEMQRRLIRPEDPRTFERCKLDWSEQESHGEAYALHADLLKLRREDAVFGSQRADRLDGGRLGEDCFVIRYFGAAGDDRLLVVNFGRDLHRDPAPQPLLAPPEGARWKTLWSSEDPAYGGTGTPPLESEENWRVPGEAAVVLAPEPQVAIQD